MREYKSIGEALDDGAEMDRESVLLLEILERVNPCGQIYYRIREKLAVSYRLKINLTTYKNLFPLRMDTRILGLPISIAAPGYWISKDDLFYLLSKIKGLTLVLNIRDDLPGSVPTLPTYILKNSYRSLEDYLFALRSSYRRRLKQAIEKRTHLIMETISPEKFTVDHYKLYLKVMERTLFPLEVLPIEFFREYPAVIREFRDASSERLLAFVQTKTSGNRKIFMFCGFDRKDVEKYDLYWNMLLSILEEGIEEGIAEIELGQTSGETKLKLGCKEEKRFMLVYHSNPILRKIIKAAVPLFAYNETLSGYRVFRQEETNEDIS